MKINDVRQADRELWRRWGPLALFCALSLVCQASACARRATPWALGGASARVSHLPVSDALAADRALATLASTADETAAPAAAMLAVLAHGCTDFGMCL